MRAVNVAATASAWGIPAAVKPAISPVSITPIPPGTGAAPPTNEATQLISDELQQRAATRRRRAARRPGPWRRAAATRGCRRTAARPCAGWRGRRGRCPRPPGPGTRPAARMRRRNAGTTSTTATARTTTRTTATAHAGMPSPPPIDRSNDVAGHDQADADQDDLDDEPGDRVQDAGADGHRRREALLLEEPDDEGGVAGRAPDEPGEGVGELDADDRPEREAGRHRAEHGHGLGDLGELGDHEGQHDPPPDRPGEDVAHGGDAGELGVQEVDAEGEGGGQQDRAEREAVQLGRLGRLDAGQRRAGVAEAAQQGLRRGDVALGRAGQRRRLEEGQQVDEVVGAERPVGGRQRPVLADELGGGGEQLHAIEPQAGVGGRRGGVVETDESGRPGVVEHDVAQPGVAVGDAPVVQPRAGSPTRRRARRR